MAAPIPTDKRDLIGPYLSDIPDGKIVVVCEKCAIRKQFDGRALLERLDEDTNIPSLADAISKKMNCYLALNWSVQMCFRPRCQMALDRDAMVALNAGLLSWRIGHRPEILERSSHRPL